MDISKESDIIRQQLQDIANEYTNKLFLEGLFNPFIRTHSFPPTHININYLLNPGAISNFVEFSGLYDEHKEGFAYGRADPLRFPGVTLVPFDPNELPTPTAKPMTFGSVLKSLLYSNDKS